jgi:hypothetical protein
MTLVCSVVSRQFVLQVSDRLVTQGEKPFDPLANKSLICLFPNAVAAISYSGDAYLRGTPTDHWIAERLIGQTIDPNAGSRQLGPVLLHRDVWHALGDLGRALDVVAPSCPITPPELAVVGWQRHRKGGWSFAGRLRYSTDAGCYAWQQTRYRWYWNRNHTGAYLHPFFSIPAGYLPPEETPQILRTLDGMTADEAEATLVRIIRRVAANSKRVGTDCVSILLREPRHLSIRARYLPATPTMREWKEETHTQVVSTAFRPWLLQPGWFDAPSEYFARSSLIRNMGPFEVTMECAASTAAEPPVPVSPENAPTEVLAGGFRYLPPRAFP